METSANSIPSYFFDASAIVKLAAPEPGSARVRELLVECLAASTSWVLVAEALNVLKRKWLTAELTPDAYRESVCTLFSYLKAGHLDPVDVEVRNGHARLLTHEVEVFGNHQKFADLDVADTLQLTAIRGSVTTHLNPERRTKLVTADKALGTAAESVGISVILVTSDS